MPRIASITAKMRNDMTIATVREDGYPQATAVSYVNDGLAVYFSCSTRVLLSFAVFGVGFLFLHRHRSHAGKTAHGPSIDRDRGGARDNLGGAAGARAGRGLPTILKG